MSDRPEEIRDLSKSQVQQVNDMMAEAMKESVSSNGKKHFCAYISLNMFLVLWTVMFFFFV